METKKKLDNFFEENGIQKVWLAKKLGMSKPMIYAALAGTRPIPFKYWKKVLEYTRGYISQEDLVHDYIEHHLKKVSTIDWKRNKDGKSWTVSLKDKS